MAKSKFAAGGGNARVAELKKKYPNLSDAGIRNMVEKMGERALAGRGKQTANKLTDAQAFSYGGGAAALAKLKKESGGSYSDSYLRGQIISRGRKAIAGRSDGSLPTPSTPSKTDKEVKKDNKQYGNTVPAGSFGISKKGKEQAAKNRKNRTTTNNTDKRDTKSEVRTLTNNNRGGGGGGGDRTPTPTPPRNNSAPTPPRRKPTGQGSRGYTMKANLGKLLKKDDNKSKTESKSKSRLEKALSWASDKKNKDAWKKKK